MSNQQTAPAGWYNMQGDPPNTTRWWDGAQWIGEPRLVETAAPQPVATAAPQPVVAAVGTGASIAEPAVEYGSMLANDLASYWDSMEEPVDPAKAFAKESLDLAESEARDAEAHGDYPHMLDSDTSHKSAASPLKWMILPYKNYANFKGRSCRAELWWFVLFTGIAQFALWALGAALGVGYASVAGVEEGDQGLGLVVVVLAPIMLFSLFSMIPGLALQVRRLHDTGRSGMPLLVLPALPFIGVVFVLVLGPDAAPLFALIGLLAIIYSLWLTVVIYFTPSHGWNKYGAEHIRPE